MATVFLGGTCNGSQWRERLKPLLTVSYFDPVVEDWDEVAQQRELHERQTADYVLYVITPKMTGVYSIAEAADDGNKRPASTLFCVLGEDGDGGFAPAQFKSLQQVMLLVCKNGAKGFYSLGTVAHFLNSCATDSAR